MLSAQLTERLSPNSENLRRGAPPWLPFQGSWLGAAETERLLQICYCHRLRRPYLFRLAGKDRGEKGRLDAFGAFCL